MLTTLSLSAWDVMPVNDLWITSVCSTVSKGTACLSSECRWRTSASWVWLMCSRACFLSNSNCILLRKRCSSRFRACFPTFLSSHLYPCSFVLFWMTFSVWDGCQPQNETNEMRVSLEFWLSPQSKPEHMRGSLSCTWNSEVTFDYLFPSCPIARSPRRMWASWHGYHPVSWVLIFINPRLLSPTALCGIAWSI